MSKPCTDEDISTAIDYLFRYESDLEEDNVEGVHRVAEMLGRFMKARWRRNGRRQAKAKLRAELRAKMEAFHATRREPSTEDMFAATLEPKK